MKDIEKKTEWSGTKVPEPVQKRVVERDEVVEEMTRRLATRAPGSGPKKESRGLIGALIAVSMVPAIMFIVAKFPFISDLWYGHFEITNSILLVLLVTLAVCGLVVLMGNWDQLSGKWTTSAFVLFGMGAMVVLFAFLPSLGVQIFNVVNWYVVGILLIGASFAMTATTLMKERMGFFSSWFVGVIFLTSVPFVEFVRLFPSKLAFGSYEGARFSAILVGLVFVIGGVILYRREKTLTTRIEEELNSGDEFIKLNRYDEALKRYDRAIRAAHLLAPPSSIGGGKKPPVDNYEAPWLSKGYAYMKLGRYNEALPYLDLALDANP